VGSTAFFLIMNKNARPKTVMETILDWSGRRLLWQRDALRRIVSNGTPDEASILEMLSLCKKEHGGKDIEIEAVPLEAVHLPANPGDGSSIALESISDIVGVNQLAPRQTLVFETGGLTVIYGPNGAGKSGYGRILKRACRSRKAGEIMPDAFNPPAAGGATALIAIRRDGAAQPAISWRDSGRPDPVMSAISVFDKECASVHVQEKNEVAFRPFGLDIPDDLAGVCQKVKEKLTVEQAQIEALRDPVFEKPTWNPSTAVGQILSNLNPDTNLAPLEILGEVSDEECARQKRLTEDLVKDPVEAAAEQRLFANNVRQLIAVFEKAAGTYSDEAMNGLKTLANTARSKREAATLASDKAFGGLAVPGVGSEAWRALWEAARHYSDHVAYPENAFPPEHDEACVLCHQPLSPQAKTRMGSFETFIKEDTETQAAAAEKSYADALKTFVGKKIDIRVIAQTRRRIALLRAPLAKSILRFMASADLRRLKCLAGLKVADPLLLPPFAHFPKAELEQFERDLHAYAEQLDNAADKEGRKKLQLELDALDDRIAVPELQKTAKKEVKRLRSLRLVKACIADTATKAITTLGNDIADNVISPKMRDQFQSEIVRLAAEKVRVEVVRSGGQFGSPQYQVRLFANPKAKVHIVLSEGEQTCVALAAFLTELTTASHKSALVFDDPVTSLDHRWRRKVAERLIAEASERQIVVFTHDLVFVNDLHDLAVREHTKVKLVSLSRGPAGTGVVSDGLPWQHARVEDRVDKLEKAARAAKALYDANDEQGYRNEVVAI
jgi:energy-coupling factor transporter ATP-binding protein EcfA2